MSKQRNETEVLSRNIGFNMRVSYDASGRQEYVGFAYPNPAGTPDGSPIWQVYHLEYDGSGRVTKRYYADGTDDYIKVWSDRTTYSYT